MNPNIPIYRQEKIVIDSFNFLHTVNGNLGSIYLKSRGISKETAQTFNIGYCDQSIDRELAGSIIIPIYDSYGNLKAIMKRTLPEFTPEGLQAYWNTRYKKSHYLYGLYLTKNWIYHNNYIIIVECPFDAMFLWQSGIKNIVALCGTNISSRHISIILRYCKRVILCLDRDENFAGQKSSDKGKILFDEAGFDTATVELPIGTDPDKFIMENGVETFQKLINKSLILGNGDESDIFSLLEKVKNL